LVKAEIGARSGAQGPQLFVNNTRLAAIRVLVTRGRRIAMKSPATLLLLIGVTALPSKAEEVRSLHWLSSSTFSMAMMATEPSRFTMLSTSSVLLPELGVVVIISFWRDEKDQRMIRCRELEHALSSSSKPTPAGCFVALAAVEW
jgi:hypothetical protein